MARAIDTVEDAVAALRRAWPLCVRESRTVLAGELHYQAMLYHALRTAGRVPADQLGMNVKQRIDNPRTELFRTYDKAKHVSFQGFFEPTPDAIIFAPAVRGDWRRRRARHTLRHMLVAVEVKASERDRARLRPGEVIADIEKLAALRRELRRHRRTMQPAIVIFDLAPGARERMTMAAFAKCRDAAAAAAAKVQFYYVSPLEQYADPN